MPGMLQMLWIISGMDKRGRCCKKQVAVEDEEEEPDAEYEREKEMLFPNTPGGIPEKGFERLARDVKLRKNKEGKLGIHIVEIGGKVLIDDFLRGAGGLKGAAEASGEVKKGDWIVGIGTMLKDDIPGADEEPDDAGTVDIMQIDIEKGKKPGEVGGEAFHEVLHMLKHVPNPVVLRLHAPLKKEKTGPDEGMITEVRRCSVQMEDPEAIIKEMKGREKKAMKRERDDIEDILATAAEKGVLKHQVNATAEIMNATVAIGNLSALRQEVTMHFRRINRIDKKKKQTLLHVCCREGFFEAVDFMLNPDNHPKRDNVQVDLEFRNADGRNPLLLCFTPPHMTTAMRAPRIVATYQHELAESDRMIPGGPSERTKLIELLLQRGAKVNILDAKNWTPLMLACLWGWAQAAQHLIAAGAKLHAVNNDGDTALYLSASLGHAGCVKALLDHNHPHEKVEDFWELEPANNGEGESHLTLAVARGDQYGNECVRALIKGGVNVDQANGTGQTPIKLAAKGGNKDVCNQLLYEGVRAGKHAIERLMENGDDKSELLQKIEAGTYLSERAQASKRNQDAVRQRAAEEAVWQRFHDPYNKGAVYYYNRITGQSQWDQPHDWVEPVAVGAGARRRSLAFEGSTWLHNTTGETDAHRDVGEMTLPGQAREVASYQQRRKSVAEIEAEIEEMDAEAAVEHRGRRRNSVAAGESIGALWPESVNADLLDREETHGHLVDSDSDSDGMAA